MSQDFHHQGIFSFTAPDESQIPIRDNNNKIRLQGFENHHHTLAGVVHAPEGASSSGMHPAVYETAGMLSEMLNFGGGGPAVQQISGAGMQFFLTDAQPRPATPPPQHEFLNWVDPEGGGGVRGLSLSLSSTLEAAKAEEEMRMGGGGGGGMMFFGSSSNNNNSQGHHSPNQHVMHLQGYGLGHPSGHFGFGSVLTPASSSLGAVHALRNSRFVRPAQELLEEFCSVGRGHQRKNKFSRNDSINSTTSSAATGSGGVGPSSSNSAKNLSVLSPSDRMEHQRRKVKLLSMLDEVERRYSQYCEQLQMVVNSFDVVMGYGAAIPYTALAQKAMSRHFRCLKDAIQVQLKHSCELLGEKDVSMSTGLTKGETPRLKALEHSLRQQRAFNQMGIMEQEAWRPQRGLPERSVNVLRAWLFEHFLHPYPSDADKHLLARQTGLSRNQVSNWFINARVRLWKPMVEDMYQQESKDKGEGEGEEEEDDDEDGNEDGKRTERETYSNAQTSMPETTENDTSLYSAGVWPAAASRYADDGGVGLTLGLRHSEGGGGGGNPPEKSGFSFREFGG